MLKTGKRVRHHRRFSEDFKLKIVRDYISPQINRAEKNKSYFYNCYGKEEKFYIENQG